MIRMSAPTKTASNAAVNLLPDPASRIGTVGEQVGAYWVTQAPLG
jgi:hypothetical protein